MLRMLDISEVIVVDDGSQDDTPSACEQFSDERLRIIRHDSNLGVAAARNTGIEAATGSWVLFGEDDCRFPESYARVLLSEAHRHDAAVVGAPLLHVASSDEEIEHVAALAPRQAKPPMDEVGVFPLRPIETPFVPARALIGRPVLEKVRFYDGFPVNGFREETDFFVQAARAGFRCIFTPDTYCYQLGTWSGGQHHTSTLRYEYWALRNNWTYLRRHGDWLVEQGYIRSRLRSQLCFACARGRGLVQGATRARLLRLRSRLAARHRAPTS
jgi:GT2 family glycosyltransferase